MPPRRDASVEHVFPTWRARGRVGTRWLDSPAGARRSPSRIASRPPGARARRSASARPAGLARSLRPRGVAPTTTHGREHRVKESRSRAGADRVRALSDGRRGECGQRIQGLRLEQRAGGARRQELHRTAVQQRSRRPSAAAPQTVEVCAGTYTEQVEIAGPTKIIAFDGTGSVTLAMPATPARSESACDTKSNESEGAARPVG